jgi:hypothetical protein
VRINPDDRDPHPAVIISGEEIAGNEKLIRVNVLYCSTKRPGIQIEPYQVLLNSADGLDSLTVVDCGIMYVVYKNSIISSWGKVSLERRRAIKRKIIERFGLV